MPVRNCKNTSTFQIEKNSPSVHSFKESSSPKFVKSPSLQRVPGVFGSQDGAFNSQESPKAHCPPPQKNVGKWIACGFRKGCASWGSSIILEVGTLSFAEWLYAVLGSIGAAIFGSFNPLLAYVIALIVTAYYWHEHHHLEGDVDRWCLIIACMGIVTVVANFLQHFYFGLMGEKMTEWVRRMMFSAMLRNEVGWFDNEDNSADNLSMRLANDAIFVSAAFSNRLSIFIQDSAAVIVAILIGMLLH
ncbi:hypothetical protein F3Y22_tig00000452pilonHSYRG00155 [Hibiscus syriacus]|uniref:ABC transmembrane type-1 domain-containing protein n=1 Tax=Hibiscus syriacus TaxID=106335 RepID=A0A6A3D0R2_HIBSY|nr:hypothetical protein F3Y22_tig00000452pilonHSYRG00155 [Hibiscus syriacus]